MRGHLAADERAHGALKILRFFQLIGKRFQRIRRNAVQHDVRVGNAAGGRHHAEFKLVARESERRGAVSVRRVAADERKRRNAYAHNGRGRHALVAPPDDVIDDRRQLVA